MRGDWHRYNLKRRVADLPPVSSDDYNNKVLAAQATNKAAAAHAAYVQSCAVCRKTYYSEHAYQNHIGSKAHRQREAASLRGETLSVNGSTTSKTESSEPRDPEAEAEFEKVVAGMKDTSIHPPIPARPSAPSPDAEPKREHPMSPEKPITSTPLSRCFFCNYDSPTWKLSVTHMTKIHGLFLPEQNYLVDLEGLLQYLQAKILQNFECLWCHKLKSTADGVQTHMRDKGHCRIAFESEEEMIEVGQFYDFSSTYSDGEQDSDTEMDGMSKSKNGGVKLANGKGDEEEEWETDSSFSSLDSNELTSVPNDDKTRAHGRLHLHRHHSQTDPRPHKTADGYHSHAHHHNNAVFYDEYEMHLPSGRVAGHRSLKKYYRQNLHSYPSMSERMARAQRLIDEGSSGDDEMEDFESNPPATPPRSSALTRRSEAGMLGVTNAQRREVRGQEIRSRQREQRAQNRYQAKIEKQANSQKHFRVSLAIRMNYMTRLLTTVLGSSSAISASAAGLESISLALAQLSYHRVAFIHYMHSVGRADKIWHSRGLANAWVHVAIIKVTVAILRKETSTKYILFFHNKNACKVLAMASHASRFLSLHDSSGTSTSSFKSMLNHSTDINININLRLKPPTFLPTFLLSPSDSLSPPPPLPPPTHPPNPQMAKKPKSRTLSVRLISMALTGYFRTMIRPRTSRPLSMMKYDPVVRRHVLFLEAKKKGK